VIGANFRESAFISDRCVVVLAEGIQMTHMIHNAGVSRHIGHYSDAIEVESGLRWLYTSGTPGLDAAGELPEGIEAQTRQAWRNIFAVPAEAKMLPGDIVKVNTSLLDAGHRAEYARVRAEVLGDLRPAFMLSVVSELIRPDMLVEVEVIAAAP
ncbi:MAG: hypothetical protein QOE95_2323, partial [Gaiellaceae bacterium]|nr:hypothetical protein [Gaiellaceae bacterium]